MSEADEYGPGGQYADGPNTEERFQVPTTVEEMWDCLLELGVSEETLQCVSNINGYSTETMEAILYAGTQIGYRSFSQLED